MQTSEHLLRRVSVTRAPTPVMGHGVVLSRSLAPTASSVVSFSWWRWITPPPLLAFRSLPLVQQPAFFFTARRGAGRQVHTAANKKKNMPALISITKVRTRCQSRRLELPLPW